MIATRDNQFSASHLQLYFLVWAHSHYKDEWPSFVCYANWKMLSCKYIFWECQSWEGRWNVYIFHGWGWFFFMHKFLLTQPFGNNGFIQLLLNDKLTTTGLFENFNLNWPSHQNQLVIFLGSMIKWIVNGIARLPIESNAHVFWHISPFGWNATWIQWFRQT